MAFRLVGPQHPGVDQILDQAVVARQPDQPVVAEAIGAAVAGPETTELIALNRDSDYRRSDGPIAAASVSASSESSLI
jgi:hypothetical protein